MYYPYVETNHRERIETEGMRTSLDAIEVGGEGFAAEFNARKNRARRKCANSGDIHLVMWECPPISFPRHVNIAPSFPHTQYVFSILEC